MRVREPCAITVCKNAAPWEIFFLEIINENEAIRVPEKQQTALKSEAGHMLSRFRNCCCFHGQE